MPATVKPSLQRPSAGISRVDQPSHRTHGFVVRFGYRKTASGYRPKVSKFFADKSNGGKRAAWQAAERFLTAASRGKRSR